MIHHNSSVALLGSCFTTNIGERLTDLKMNTAVNPFGITFSPLTLASQLRRLVEPTPFLVSDLQYVEVTVCLSLRDTSTRARSRGRVHEWAGGCVDGRVSE